MSLCRIRNIYLVVKEGLSVKKGTALPAYLAQAQQDLAHLLGRKNLTENIMIKCVSDNFISEALLQRRLRVQQFPSACEEAAA